MGVVVVLVVVAYVAAVDIADVVGEVGVEVYCTLTPPLGELPSKLLLHFCCANINACSN